MRYSLSLAAAIASAVVFAAGPQGGVAAMKRAFEENLPEVLESAKLSFDGVPAGHDVYNCSIPFEWKGARYLFGRVEPHDKWASSVVMLFRETGKDAWTRVGEFGTLELEDPYVAWIRGELVVGGTRVTKVDGKVKTYCGAFYRDHGRGPLHLEYFTVGPDRMKDIRLVELRDGRIGVFSRPRGEEVRRKYGSEAVIGFTTVASLEELTAGAIENAKVIEGVFGKDEWGGCNQAYLRPDGTVLVAGHLCCAGEEASNGLRRQIYCNAAFTFDPVTHRASHIRVVATRRMYPASEPKVPHLDDCVFTSGFVFNADGTVDVYTGLCDAAEARVRLRTLPGGGAEWIRPAKGPSPDRNAAVFARRFANRGEVKRAVWSVAGQGVFTATVNGREVGGFLKPGLTQIERRVFAHDFDVTALLDCRAGATNALGAIVTAGWWRDDLTGRQLRPFLEGQFPWYRPKHSAFRAELALEYADGATGRIVTGDGEWTAAYQGPVRDAGIYEGERYDAREEALPPPKARAVPCEEPVGACAPAEGPGVLLREDLVMRPKDWKGPVELKPWTRYVFDFGQNCAAVPRFRVEGAEGTVLTLRTGEMVNDTGDYRRGNDGPAGTLYRENLRKAPSFVRYVLKGGGEEEYLPRHTYFGYRYCDIEVCMPVRLVSLESVPVTSVAADAERGAFECGVPEVNRLVRNAYWGMLSNYLSVPTDCPQRSERLGWTADTWVFADTALYFADVAPFLGKWMTDMRDAQSADGAFPIIAPLVAAPPPQGGKPINGWSDAGVIVPYLVWRQTGSREFVVRNWEAMERYMDCLRANKGPNNMFGDWVHLEKTEYARFFWLYDAQLMRRMATALGKADAAAKYADDEAAARAKLRKDVLNADGSLKAKFDGQANGLWALKTGVATNDAERTLLRENLLARFAAATNHLQTGFMGTAVLLDVLADEARSPKLAYDLLLSHDYPGWLYSVDQGATTIWERWNSYTKEKGFGPAHMNSFNHYAYGCVAGWLYRTVAGIRPDPERGGYRHFLLQPVPDPRLGWAKASLRTEAGTIVSSWRYRADGTCEFKFTVPEGTTATVTWNGTSREYGPGTHAE